ncbi:MAG TPA: glutamyl-tRNA reductase [Candidatus Anaerobutyricum stercoripullorum]|uniref:Glutamyl-tRNA reductase n=1 Tax=Candidatus Anaerobutyricum stercoripullorum TaxID=2838456 RepID=A0A9D1X539_9FIRM|nr:glutamyl-tRNA reductase [Candidatus Anaerobutyricum stercoripullorum]
MGIQIISISHKIAPLHVREMFAFTKEQQEEMMRRMTDCLEVSECVVLSTCNRTEMYVYSESGSEGVVFNRMEDVLLECAGAQEEEDIGNYLLFFHGKKAIQHLFEVAAGLDSMVIGEDQILGQVKEAHKQARAIGATGVYLNTFFRMAVTSAKKVKTDTDLSRTSVSTATLAIKVAEEALGSLRGKKVMIIGATGKIGGIVLMNMLSLNGPEVYVTTRSNKVISTKHGQNNFLTIEYEDRYDYIDAMDVIISATSSPHYTLTCSRLRKCMRSNKPRVFVDLAVPMDIESRVSDIGGVAYYNIDDFTRIAKENNQKKLQEARAATGILEEYELQFEQWMVFQKSLPIMAKVRDNFMKVTEHKGVEKAFDHLFYWVRENNDPEDLEMFFRCLNH